MEEDQNIVELDHYAQHKDQYDNPSQQLLQEQEKDEKHHKKPKALLYKDEFVVLDEDGITIDMYFFPGGSKRIHYHRLERVQTDKEMGLTVFEYKGWGMGLSPIWWALDMARMLGPSIYTGIILTVHDDSIKKGFSVRDPTTVLRIIKQKMNEAKKAN
eukprot:TRINITY_DN16552_c0_g2_i9.p1 TRINITY_DN16552_c0_g2~~TRINITY_DN16552_c0_g2_i9.p1  ORF type:complete len:158 (-),score=45.82 TRINITY_DN16552_c0_g2_i9:319-792(-)